MSDTAFTPEALAALTAPLDPSRVAVLKDGPASGTPYMIGHDIIETLGRIFGHGNWGFQISGQPWCIEQGPPKPDGKRSYELWGVMGTLGVRGGIPISDVGTCVRNGDGHAGLDMAIKGAVTDCVKRCARNYGEQFGLVLYDKTVNGADLRARFDEWTLAQRGESLDTGTGEVASKPTTETSSATTQPATAETPPAELAPRPAWWPELTRFLHEHTGLKANSEAFRNVLGVTSLATEREVVDAIDNWLGKVRGRTVKALLAQVLSLHQKFAAQDKGAGVGGAR